MSDLVLASQSYRVIERGNSVTSFTIGGAAGKKEFSSPAHHHTDTVANQRASSAQTEPELGQASLYVFCDKSHNKVG